MSEPYATRRELDQLANRVSQMDEHGTRGVGVVQVQLTQVIRDVAKLETDMTQRFATHQSEHERDTAGRAANRRWALGFAVAALGLLGGLYPYLHLIARH